MENSVAPQTSAAERVDWHLFLQGLFRQWPLILGVTVVATVVAAAWLLTRPESYTAEANVALLDVRSVVVFDPEFTTVPSDSAGGAAAARQDALQAMARSDALVAALFDSLRDELALGTNEFNRFRNALTVTSAGDLLRLRVTWRDQTQAAMVANAWASEFVALANRSYVSTSTQAPEEAYQAAQGAFADYQGTQKALESFIANSQLQVLQREAAEVESLIAEQEQARVVALSLANSAVLSATQEIAAASQAAMTEEMTNAVSAQIADRSRRLNDWYDRRAAWERLRWQLQDLEQQLQSQGESAAAANGDALALLFARSGLLRESQQVSDQGFLLQLDVSQLVEGDEPLAIEDVRSLLAVADEAIAEAEAEIARLTESAFAAEEGATSPAVSSEHQLGATAQDYADSLLESALTLPTDAPELQGSELGQSLATLSQRYQTLQAEIEQIQAEERELHNARDGAWELYLTLDNKAREVAAQFATGASQARLALEATTPPVPDRRQLITTVGLAGVLGFFLATVYVAASQLWSGFNHDTPVAPSRDETQVVTR